MGVSLTLRGKISNIQYLINENISVLCWKISARHSHSYTIDCDTYSVVKFILGS
uniref:Macaca fascicularis brain cDNA clone: QmoA-12049, similar to human RAS p21 protein activator 2 (RASA2), mRNA, RefSeq: NM_006506.2 n=1 Tax=Macaca fascicularis TaxID=9541 RepID=I7G8N8_MACFA|nr:unnamed protein product [Macaca fascicularis]